jgi:transcriptional regulator with XRE-family HTH domain
MSINRITKEESSGSGFRAQAGAKNLIGFQIRQFREKRGWSQHRLAESFKKAGILITRNMIASIETQRCIVTDYQVIFFARVLGVSWKSLFPEKSILENVTPPMTRRKESAGSSKTGSRHSMSDSSTDVSAKKWSVCKMSCKSLKITFRRPS